MFYIYIYTIKSLKKQKYSVDLENQAAHYHTETEKQIVCMQSQQQEQPHTETWEQIVLQAFFNVESLGMLLPYMCKQFLNKEDTSKLDVISATVIVFLTVPLHLIVSEYGASLFYGKSTMSYPYHLMTDQQKKALTDLLNMPSQYNVINGKVIFKRHKDMVLVQTLPVLQALCTKIFQSQRITDRRVKTAICNIVMQRIQGYTTIASNVQRELNDWLKTASLDI